MEEILFILFELVTLYLIILIILPLKDLCKLHDIRIDDYRILDLFKKNKK